MEELIVGFNPEYSNYDNYRDRFDIILSLNHHGYTQAEREKIKAEFENLDVKMRLAFGIQEIILNPLFVNEKQGPLKECHILYYKMADLWFAYETFIEFLKAILNKKKIDKVEWLEAPVYERFKDLRYLSPMTGKVNNELRRDFESGPQRAALITYLQYCEQAAKHAQETRLGRIIPQLFTAGYHLDHTDILTIIYSIRNNFVHGGETTVVPDNFSFEYKRLLLRILYPYLTMVVISVTNQAISEI